ncbi:MAG: tryptophan-rich sensory protein [Corynebacterium sp.]|uniref:tryptophan-rich sensory protein n=1 Tax=Corynebacterium sp. TaxID=1720 RepID=UPI0026DFDB4A|nr:tryptophan-rich sensory protein [Corynebacterium sp.]MDO5669062.1 tryptophan-rich sensory protein [Corynebacterium sp.]
MSIITVLGVAAAIAMAYLGSGALVGDQVSEAAGGALSADATPLAPGSPAFSIWAVIYFGLAAYAVWQLTPTARASERQRVLRPWAILSALLNAAWLFTVQLGALWLSVLVIVALLAVLIRILYILGRPRTGGIVELALTDGTFGLYFGWVLAATFANTWATFVAEGFSAFEEIPVGLVGIVVATVVAVVAAVLNGGRIAPALATAWGLAWIAIARTDGAFENEALVWTAATAAAVIILVAVVLRALPSRRAPRTGQSTTAEASTEPGPASTKLR